MLVGDSVVRGAVLGLSFCADSRAVPRVRDWDPQPRATQKVSVCVLGSGGAREGTGTGCGIPWAVARADPWGSPWSRWEPCKEGNLDVKCSTGAMPGNVPVYQGCVQASRTYPKHL